MKLDICAPQVIFPDDFQSEDPMLVVVDLGRILLTNSQGKQSNHLSKWQMIMIYLIICILLPYEVSNSAHTFRNVFL